MALKLLTVRDLSELFQRDEDTIRRWIKEGTVFPSAFKVKDGWFVPLTDVKKLMSKRRCKVKVVDLMQSPLKKSSHESLPLQNSQ